MKLNYNLAFVKERTIKTEKGITIFEHHQIGALTAPSGLILACDPVVDYDRPAFKTPVPAGKYPVILSVAKFDYSEIVAFAKLEISREWTVRWEMATLDGQDAASLDENSIFGYPVDAGVGCFMDAETAHIFAGKIDEDFADSMIEEMYANQKTNWIYANFEFAETSGNLIVFSSGYGDGFYASYFGFDENDKVACLVTDFALFDELYYESNYDDFK